MSITPETHQQPNVLPQNIYSEKPGNFPVPEPETNVGDLKAFHDELDRLINGENPHGEFKSFFRNPTSLSFENVEGDDQVDLSNPGKPGSRDSGNDFSVPQISDIFGTFPFLLLSFLFSFPNVSRNLKILFFKLFLFG